MTLNIDDEKARKGETKKENDDKPAKQDIACKPTEHEHVHFLSSRHTISLSKKNVKSDVFFIGKKVFFACFNWFLSVFVLSLHYFACISKFTSV